MSLALFEELKHYIGFEAQDAEALAWLLSKVNGKIPAIVEDFYHHILQHEGTRRILQDPAQVERLKGTLRTWLAETLSGPHDAAYYERRNRIGQVHVRVGLPQAYVFSAMAHIRRHLEAAIVEEAGGDRTRMVGTLAALAKILDLELALIAGSYHETEKFRALAEQAGLARLGEMAAIVAHEVKNPLAGIGGAIQVIGSHLPSASPDRPIIQEILKRIEMLNGTIQDLLLYARPRPPKLAPVSLRGVLQDTVTLLAQDPMARETRIGISGEDPVVPADAELLKPCFLNLLLNASQAMGGKGAVDIAIATAGDRIRVTLKDDGPGIPPEVLARIFEPFFSTKHKGTGLGLPIAKRTVESHGGEIRVDCPPGGGTLVTVLLPR